MVFLSQLLLGGLGESVFFFIVLSNHVDAAVVGHKHSTYASKGKFEDKGLQKPLALGGVFGGVLYLLGRRNL